MQITPDFSHTQSPSKNTKEMLSTRRLDDGRLLFRINSSSLEIMKECWRKAGLALEHQYVANREGNPTLYGTAIHEALRVFYMGDLESRSLPKNFKRDMEIIASGNPPSGIEYEALVYAAAVEFVNSCKEWNTLPPQDKHSISSGIYVLEHYFRKYINDPWQVYVDDKGPFVERPFTLRVYEDKTMVIEIFGTIDVVLRHTETNRLVITDHKTTGQAGKSFYQRIQPNDQYTFYTMGAREVFNVDTYTFMVNGIEKKNRPVRQAMLPNFPRQETKRTKEDFDRLVRELIWYTQDYMHLLEQFPDAHDWPMGNVNACTMWGGCQFHDVCSVPKNVQPTVLKANYKTKQEIKDGQQS